MYTNVEFGTEDSLIQRFPYIEDDCTCVYQQKNLWPNFPDINEGGSIMLL